MTRTLLLAVLLAGLALSGVSSVRSAPTVGSITVNTLKGDRDTSDGLCSLREAVLASSATDGTDGDCSGGTGEDLIVFSVPPGEIVLEDTLWINSNVVIEGPIILGGGGTVQVFKINTSDDSLTLLNLTVQNGYTSGAGGAIYNKGTLNLIGTSFQNNEAGGNGGAICNEGQGELAILMSTFAGNSAENGGAISLSGSETGLISLSNFSGNTSETNGGALTIGSEVEVEISDAIFSGNIATAEGENDGGGAIYNASNSLEIVRSAFNGNLCPSGPGGALFNRSSSVATISDSSFNGNISGDYDSNGQGGAIYNIETLNITRATFNGNIASLQGKGGAIYNDKVGIAQVTNSTFFANDALAGQGGAIYNTDSNNLVSKSTVTLRNVTFTGNVAAEGGAIYNDEELVELYNTIVEQGGLGAGGTCAGTAPTDSGGNLQYPSSDCGDNITVANPLLDAPTYNGGAIVSLLTIALQDGSPAIDAADNATCAAAPVNNEDQRGESRPLDGNGDGNAVCDVGAMEAEEAFAGYGSNPVQPGPIQFGSAVTNTTITAGFEVFETGNTILNVNPWVVSGEHAYNFGINTPAFSIADGGEPQMIELECTPNQVGERTAELIVTTNDFNNLTVTYQLECTGVGTPQPGYGSTPAEPGPINFGDVDMDTTDYTSFEIFESGMETLNIESPLLGGDNAGEFGLLTAFPLSIADGAAAQSVQLSCHPTEPGIRTASLTLTTNDPLKPSVTYNLTCHGHVLPGPPLAPRPIEPGTLNPYDIAISPDGNHAYVSSHGANNIRVFTRTLASGDLQFNSTHSHADLSNPYSVEVSPDGKHVFAVGYASDSLLVMERDPATGQLSDLDMIKDGDLVSCGGDPPLCLYVNGLNGAEGLDLSPDGKNVYVAARDDNALAVFVRETPTGTVTFRQSKVDGLYDVRGLADARDVAVSPDGLHVYAASSDPGAVAVFDRDPPSGWLTFVQAYTDTTETLLGGARSIAINPDGSQVYVVATGEDALTVFSRDQLNGTLTITQVLSDGGAIDGLGGAHGVTTNPDGSQVYVVSVFDNALAVFDRDPVSGELSFRDVYVDGVDGVDGLWWPPKVTTSPGGEQVYVTGYQDNAIAIFDIARPMPVLISLDPSSATAGDPSFTLTTYGERFSSDSLVRWNGSERPTTFVSSYELQATIYATDVLAAQVASITVHTPPPGGGESNELHFSVNESGDNPIPTLINIEPTGAMAGDPGFTMLLNGNNFIDGAVAQWNGEERQTTFVSSSQLQAAIPITDLLAPGSAGVSVFNPGPGGGDSNTLDFTIAAPGQNPVPSIAGMSPSSVQATGAGGHDLPVTINGANFIPESMLYFEGNMRVTGYISSTQLQTTFTAGDTAFEGVYGVTVLNPEPGGGASNVAEFVVVGQDENPVPAITSLDLAPGSGDALYTLVVEGSNFMTGTEIYWNNEPRATQWVSDTQATTDVNPEDVPGQASINVVNPEPGGGSSNTVLLTLNSPPVYLAYLPVVLKNTP